MAPARTPTRLDRPVDGNDHVLGPSGAAITLVEYGSYACPYCRAANDRIATVRDDLGDRLRYVFRHKPLTGSDIARRAAVLAEQATPEQFWDIHVALMTRSAELTEDDLVAVAQMMQAIGRAPEKEGEPFNRARARVESDEASARASGVLVTPTFFINSRRYDGPWDESSFEDAMLGSLGHRVRAAALDFASWAPSAGVLLLLAAVLAVGAMNTGFGEAFEHFWERPVGLAFGGAAFSMSLRHWINDGLLTIFFLVVGLEIKREFTVGRLASRKSAAMPIAGALGGMTAPALIYLLLIQTGPWAHGWGVPMATDTAFAVAIIAMLGSRVPVELRIFLTAAAIVDDIGAIAVVAIFYSGALQFTWLAAALVIVGALALLNRWHVYSLMPYALLGITLWACVFAGGLHATLAGVTLALFIPTRPPANLQALMTQARAIVTAEARRSGEVLHHRLSAIGLRALDAIHDRIESPADRLLRRVGPRSSYVVLPLFALANAGVVLSTNVIGGHETLMLGIAAGLVIGKPAGFMIACALAVRLGLALKPNEYSWRQLFGAGALAGIGFTISLFIAGEAFPQATDFAAAKIAIFAASVVSTLIGIAVLWHARTDDDKTGAG